MEEVGEGVEDSESNCDPLHVHGPLGSDVWPGVVVAQAVGWTGGAALVVAGEGLVGSG